MSSRKKSPSGANEKGAAIRFTPHGHVQMKETDGGTWFTTTYAQPFNFGHKSAVVRSYLEAEGLYRLPLRIDATISLTAPGLCVLLGERGKIDFCSTWDGNQRIVDIVDPPAKFTFNGFANQMPLNAPVKITIIYNLKSMQILIDGEQRYYSVKERYMKYPAFSDLNAAGFSLRLACHKRTEVLIHSFDVAQSEADFTIEPQTGMPDPIITNIPLRPGDKPSYENIVAALGHKPTFDSMIACLPGDIRAKVVEVDAYLRAYKPLKFKRTLEKNGNKITYVASEAGVSYAIYLSRNMLTHSIQWYILTNSRENWGKRIANDLVRTLERLAEKDEAFADRMYAYLRDCVGCYGPDCGARSPYTYKGKKKQTCHGKIEFQMTLSEFDDALRFIGAIECERPQP